MIDRALRRWLLLSAAAGTLMPVSAAWAQATPAGASNGAQTNLPASAVAPAPAEDEPEPREITVTGSRIRQLDFSSPSPIISLDATAIQQSGTTNLTDFLTGYPALVGSSTSGTNSGDSAGIGETGLNLLNLRNLGTARTLVLVDGRRHVSGLAGEQSVDINTIPVDLVDGIDVLTGGASAIYGADGVTGVVNFRLKQNFEGLNLRGQAGTAVRGDAGQRLLGITIGRNFAEGRGNLALAYEYAADDRLEAKERARLDDPHRRVFILNPDDPNDDPALPDRIPARDVRYGYSSPNGAVDIGNRRGRYNFVPEFTGDGTPFDNGIDVGEGYVLGGDSTSVADYGNDLLPRIRRNIVNALGHFDVSDKLTLFAEAKFAAIRSFSLGQPSFDYGIFVDQDNPYIPDAIRAAITGRRTGVYVNRDNFDLGQRGEDILRRTIRGVGGARGDISDSFHYEISYDYGRTRVRSHYVGDIYTDRFYAAIDAVTDPATGRITCRANLDPDWAPNQPEAPRPVFPRTTFQPGECSPINLFGVGNSDPAGLAFITADTTDRSTIEQQVLTGSISGDTRNLFRLPGGPIGFAFGGEYRREKSDFEPDILEQQGLTYTNTLLPTKGRFSVKEAFFELKAPIVKDRPFAHNLEFGAALRFSDYSTIGKTTTWKADGQYAPIRDLSFRGTYSVAIRAPNISELFGGQSQSYAFFDDPCLQANLNNGTSYRVANCTTVLTALGVDPADFTDSRSFNIRGLAGGNPDLREEKATTWTAGLVANPRFLPGLTVSVDWYDIRLRNAINTADPQQLAELCVDQPSLDNPFCAAITRQQGTGLITGFVVAPQNVAQFQTAGLDLNLNYRVKTARVGTFNVQLIGGYLDKLTFVGIPGADPTNIRGTAEDTSPKYQANLDLTWALGPVTVNYGLNWYDKTLRYSHLIVNGDPDYVAPEYFYVKERWVQDFYVSVDVNEHFQFYAGVNNAFDQKPDVGYSSTPVDSVGRYVFAGFKVKAARLF